MFWLIGKYSARAANKIFRRNFHPLTFFSAIRMGSESKNGVGQQFLPGTKKMIQSLKEVVNCPEAEIYAVLKDCNMDPNEAVQRLLSLGYYATTFLSMSSSLLIVFINIL